MGLESASYVNGLNSTNPVGATDPKSQGDDHIRLIKAVLLATFPNLNGAVTVTPAVLNGVQDASNLSSGTIPAARVGASSVTQHQAALSIAASQLTGTLADARVAQSNVTQHQAALSIAASQLTGTLADARVAQSNVTQHQAALSIAASQLTGSVAVAKGGTGATDAATARTNLGIGSIATRAVTIQNGGSPSGGSDGDIFLIW